MTGTDEKTQKSLQPWIAHYPQGIDWKETFKPGTLPELFDKAVARHASRPATSFLGATKTYGDIGRQVDKAAKGLQALGVVRGTKVGLFLPNCPAFIVYYFAILKAGGTVVNYNPLYTIDELSFQVRDSDTDLMVTLDLKLLYDKVAALLTSGVLKRAIVTPFASLLPASKSVMFKVFRGREIARMTGSKEADQVILAGTLENNDGVFQNVELDPAVDVAVLQYTGGTTGTPKGAMLTHANLTINVQQSSAWTRHLTREGKERILGILPFFHVFAMSGIMNYGIAQGAEIVIMPRFVLDDAIKLIVKTRPTIMPGVPTIFSAIMNHKDAKTLDLHSLKICLSGGAPLPAEVKKGFEALTGAQVIEAYGLSETSPGATANPLDGRAKAGSIGQPLPGTMISIRELGQPSRDVRLGQPGEICIKGPQVMKGYYKKPEATAEAFVGDFFRTGDVGYMDAEGFIFIVDRIKDMIICSGFKVYPRHLEEKIYEHPAVEEVTVIGIKDRYRGEAPKAFIRLRAGQIATEADIRQHLETRLSKIEMPSEIEFRAELPKTMIGKLSKKELKAEAAQNAEPGQI